MINILNKILLVIIVCVMLTAGCRNAVEHYVDAVRYDKLEESKQAVESLDKAIIRDPQFSLAYSLKGDIYQRQGLFLASSEAYEKAVEYNPFSFKDLYNLGKVNFIIERYEYAVNSFVRALELRPEDYSTNYYTARSYFKLEEYDTALTYATEARSLETDKSELEILFGDIFTATSNYETAIIEYRKALERDGNNPEIMIPLSLAYIRSESYDVAAELLDETKKIAPEDYRIYQYLGFLNLRAKQFDLSIENYKMAASLKPGDLTTLKGSGVAYILQALRNEDSELRETGLNQWRAALRIEPNQPGLRRLLRKYANLKINGN